MCGSARRPQSVRDAIHLLVLAPGPSTSAYPNIFHLLAMRGSSHAASQHATPLISARRVVSGPARTPRVRLHIDGTSGYPGSGKAHLEGEGLGARAVPIQPPQAREPFIHTGPVSRGHPP